MNEIISEIREEEAAGGFVASLGHFIVTLVDLREELWKNLSDSVRGHSEELP